MARIEALNEILRTLQSAAPYIEACALISEDGLMTASALPPHVEGARVAGMSSTLLSLGASAAAELERGELREVIVRGDRGYAVMVRAAPGTALIVLTTKDAKLGLVFLDVSRAVDALKKVL